MPPTNPAKATSDFHPFLQLASTGKPLKRDEMTKAMGLLLEGTVSDIEAAGFLMALRARGESIEEITAAASAMRTKALKIQLPGKVTEKLIDTAGTGGDGAGTYNISTAAALIAAGAGAKVAKHGNRAATSLSGSSDVLSALGVNLEATPETIASCITTANVGFMFAAYHHKATANVAAIRKSLGVRTIFNMLGPLTNPAGARRQLMGVYDPSLCRPIANALKTLGAKKAWVVHGRDGLDELTTTTSTFVCALEDGEISEFEVHPKDAGLKTSDPKSLQGGTSQDNAVALRAILTEKSLNNQHNAYRDIAVFNAAVALIVADLANTLKEGVDLAHTAIENGSAANALAQLVELSNTTR